AAITIARFSPIEVTSQVASALVPEAQPDQWMSRGSPSGSVASMLKDTEQGGWQEPPPETSTSGGRLPWILMLRVAIVGAFQLSLAVNTTRSSVWAVPSCVYVTVTVQLALSGWLMVPPPWVAW